MGFSPNYTLSNQIARDLMRMEAARQAVTDLPLNELVLAELLNLSPRGARAIAQKWVQDGFLVIANPSKRGRTYRLANP